MLHRSDRNYEQASKCYAQAFRIDSENLQIARDLAQIQMQTRDISGLVATAEKTLSIRSNARGHWLLLAVAHTLAENRDTAAQARILFLTVFLVCRECLLPRACGSAVAMSGALCCPATCVWLTDATTQHNARRAQN